MIAPTLFTSCRAPSGAAAPAARQPVPRPCWNENSMWSSVGAGLRTSSPPLRTRIKICGLTREEDVDAAVAAGADAVGFVMYEASLRYVTAERAAELARRLPPFITPVLLSSTRPRPKSAPPAPSSPRPFCNSMETRRLRPACRSAGPSCARHAFHWAKNQPKTPRVSQAALIS